MMIRLLLGLAVGISVLSGGAAHAAPVPIAHLLRGKVIDIDGDRVTVHYDFSSERQLDDFELVTPPGLWKTGAPRWGVANGRLFLRATGAFAHKIKAQGLIRARAVVLLGQRRDQGPLVLGGPDAFLCADLFDRRFEDRGGLFFSVCLPARDKEPLKWRLLGKRAPTDVERRFPLGKLTEVEIQSNGDRHDLRLGALMMATDSTGRAPSMPTRRFGWFVRNAGVEIDELTITLDVDPVYLEKLGASLVLAEAARVRDMSPGKLANLLRKQPLSPEAAAAALALGQTGEKGLKKLYSLARHHIRKKQLHLAKPVLTALARGSNDVELRHELLQKAFPKRGAFDTQLVLATHLLRWYEANRARLISALGSRQPAVRELFFAMVRRDLSNAELKTLIAHPVLGPYAYEVLKDRKVAVKTDGSLARRRALEAHSPVAARAMLEDFVTNKDWDLVTSLMDLLADKDAKVARGAHLLLMTISGKDLPPDKDFWVSWMSAQADIWEPPPLSSPGVATAAILRGRDFLLADLAADGFCVWPTNPDFGGTRVGATALAVVALRAAGIPADHPALQKALNKTLLVDGVALRGDMQGYTYGLANLALALRSLGGKKFIEPLKAISKIIARGQLANGQWTYFCKDPKYAASAHAGTGDNSNTQYAILALRACWRTGIEIDPEVWKKNLAFWQKARSGRGGWGYGPAGSSLHELSMTAAGVATMSICMEALHGNGVRKFVRDSKRIGSGLVRLGEILIRDHYDDAEIYAMYGVERAAILTGVKMFEDFDWYGVGAAKLVRLQKESGAWGDPMARGVTNGTGYGEAVDTAYALLFLKRATTGLPGADGNGVVKVRYAVQMKRERIKRLAEK